MDSDQKPWCELCLLDLIGPSYDHVAWCRSCGSEPPVFFEDGQVTSACVLRRMIFNRA